MQEIKSKKLRWRNFMSYGNNWTEINFEDDISTFILGENLDINSRNGVGKTTIINVLCFAIYNKPFDNISLPRLINGTNAAKNTLMEVEYYYSIGADDYKIHRFRGEKTGVLIEQNNTDITLDSINETDELILQIFGRSYELFTRTIVFSGSTPPFLDLPIAQQRAFFEELFNISILSEKAVKLKAVIKNTESDIKVQTAIIAEQEKSIVAYKKRLVDTEALVLSWESSNTAKIEKIKHSLKLIEGVDFEKEQALYSKKSQLENKVSILSKDLSTETKIKSKIESDINQLVKQYEHLEANNCPYCLQLMPNAPEKMKQIEKDLEDFDVILTSKLHELEMLTKTLDFTKKELEEVSRQITYTNLPQLLETQKNVSVLQSQLNDLENADNPYLASYDLLEAEKIEEIDFTKLNELKSLLEHQQFLFKLLTDKNSFIRKKIISKTLPFLNLQINSYAKELGLPHTVTFQDDMGCEVSEYGRILDFGNLSSGEKKRVNLAMSLAFRDVLQHLHAKDNLLFIDEVDASLCSTGVDNVIKLIKEKTKNDKLSTWIIMHRDQVADRFDKVMVVKKQHGFSNIT